MSWSGLLEFKQLPGEMITGLNDKEINELVDVQQMFENDASIFDEEFDLEHLQMPSIDLLDDVSHDLDMLQKSAVPTSTSYQQT